MHDMSNTRKEIAARLGFAARSGEKDEFGGMKGLGDWTVGFTDVMKERIAQLKQLAKSLKATVTLGRVSPNGMYSGTVTRQYGPMEPPDLMAPKKVEQLIKSLGGYENDSWRYNARPGTKAAMAVRQSGDDDDETIGMSSTKAEIISFYDSHPDLTLAQLSRMTGRDVQDLKRMLMSKNTRPGAKAEFAIDARDELMMRTWIKNNYPKADNATFNKMLAKMTKEYAKDPKGYTYGGGFRAVAKAAGFSRDGAKAEMALTISTVGAKNACYEALSNLKALAQLASETNSGWDFHVTVMIDHVKSAMSQLESSPAQAGTHLVRAIDTLGMLRKIDPVRLNDIQKGSLKQLIGYVAKSLRDARANIKVVTTAARPGAKTRMTREQTEEQKAGLKIMSAADPAVGAKIAKLIKEGKPQDQAVAIALDMKRRGEL